MRQIVIEGLKLFGYHGVHEHERQEGQKFEYDLKCDVERSSGCDELDSTVDYVAVIDEVKEAHSAHAYVLLESLAEDIIERLFQKFGKIIYIEICVRKHLRLTGVDVDLVAVILLRARTDIE